MAENALDLASKEGHWVVLQVWDHDSMFDALGTLTHTHTMHKYHIDNNTSNKNISATKKIFLTL